MESSLLIVGRLELCFVVYTQQRMVKYVSSWSYFFQCSFFFSQHQDLILDEKYWNHKRCHQNHWKHDSNCRHQIRVITRCFKFHCNNFYSADFFILHNIKYLIVTIANHDAGSRFLSYIISIYL